MYEKNPSAPIVTRNDIADALTRAGAGGASILHVHSSLSAFGYVEGGAQTVIQALTDVAETITMPAMAQRDGDRRFETWNIAATPSDVGRITEVFRLTPGVCRSDHPITSVCALGPMATQLTEGHRTGVQRPGPWGGYAFGHNSPWERLVSRNARVALLGTTFQRNTLVHYVEHRIAEMALARSPEMRDGLKDWLLWDNRVWGSFDRPKMQERMAKCGLVSEAKCGNATIYSFDAGVFVRFAIEAILHTPEDWCDPSFCIWLHRAMKNK